ncbi:MAG TPA: hypothetical protein PK657_03420 [Legionella sp.]|nr:hypothetical protein [Legionella sp.]
MLGFFDVKNLIEEEKLFQKACSEEDSLAMGTDEFLRIFSHKFGVPADNIAHSEFLENKVLQNILSKCPTIPRDINISGHASWIVHSIYTALDSTLIINYSKLTLEHRKEVVDAYNKQYGPVAILHEDYYQGGSQDSVNGILFNKARFCKLILSDLIKQSVKEDQYTPVRMDK